LLEYYADNTASSGSGTLASPWNSIQKGLDNIGAGDTLYVRGDSQGRIYQETLDFPSGTSSKPVSLKAYPGEKVIVKTSSKMGMSGSYMVIEGIVFDHQNDGSDFFSIKGNYITFRNCEIRNGARDLFDVSGDYLTIDDSVIHDAKWSGGDAHCVVANPGTKGLTLRGNTIYNCGGDGLQMYASDSTSTSSYSTDLLVEGNTFYNQPGFTGENALDFKGVNNALIKNNEMYGFSTNKAFVVQKGPSNIHVENNVIHDSHRGVEFRGEAGKSQSGQKFIGNVLYNFDEYALKFDDVSDSVVYHNTIDNGGGDSIRIEGGGLKNSKIKNNLIYNTGSPKTEGMSNVEHDHNGWFSSSAGGLSGTGDITGSNPGFVNAGSHDYHLTSTSPAIDKGVDVGLPYSGSAPDLGAYEYGGSQPQKCSDGTEYGQCSTNKPKYCDNGALIDKCQTCGCPTGLECQGDGSCSTQDCIEGDLNCDSKVDIFDLVLVAQNFGKSEGDPNWNPKADPNKSGKVDIFDLVLVAQNFGKG
jgi:hypothetical protein